MRIYLAAVRSASSVRAIAAASQAILDRALFEDVLSGSMEGVYAAEEAHVRQLAAEGRHHEAVGHWISSIGSEPSVGLQIHAAESKLRGTVHSPETVTVFLIDDQAGTTPLATTDVGALYDEVYSTYVLPRLGTADPAEEQVRFYAEAGRYADAVQTWFQLIGPRYFRGDDVGCRLDVLPDVPVLLA